MNKMNKRVVVGGGLVLFLGATFFFSIMADIERKKEGLTREGAEVAEVAEVVTEGDWTVISLKYFTRSIDLVPQVLNDFEKQNPEVVIKNVELICLSGSSMPWRIFIWHTKRDESVEAK